VAPGLGDGLGDPGTLLPPEPLELGLETVEALLGHRGPLDSHGPIFYGMFNNLTAKD
jgi:hypothetical protein